jgi:hypothetical protein
MEELLGACGLERGVAHCALCDEVRFECVEGEDVLMPFDAQ